MNTVYLKLWLPVIILMLTTILIIGMFFFQTITHTIHLKQQKQTEVKQTMIRLQRFIEEAWPNGSLIEQEISALGIESEITALVLINPEKTVQYATHYAWKNKAAVNVIPELNDKTVAFLANHPAKSIIKTDSTTITAYFPVRFLNATNKIRPFSYGLLYLNYDLSHPLAAIRYQVLTESSLLWLSFLIIMLIFTVILNQLINKPIMHLIRIMKDVSFDNPQQSDLVGKGELAILGNTFNQLVTRLTESQQNLIKQKNLYALLSATNQLIIHTPSQQQLFNEICQITVKKKHLTLAWIGLVNQQTQHIEIAAKAGVVENYLDDNFFSTDPKTAQGQGPTAIAIREKRCVITNRFLDSPFTEFWHEMAAKKEIKASIAFPIYKFNQVVGAFNIYSDQEDYFSLDIVGLLNEMAVDISFALENLELNQLKQQAEDALRDKEERLAVTLDSIGDAVIVTDVFGAIIRMNPVAEVMTGWAFDQAEGKPLTEVFRIFNSITKAKVDNPVAKVLEQGVIVGLANHTVLISKQGIEFHIADSAAPIRDKNHQIVGVVLVFQNVTEQYATYAALKSSEERFKDVIEASGAYIWELDTQLRYTYLTEQVELIKGYPVEQLLGQQLINLVPAEQVESVLQVIQTAIEEKKRFELFYQNINPSGDKLWEEIKGQVVLNAQGEVIKLRGVGISINQRKHAEAEIQRLVYYDALTSLPNRRMFCERLADEISFAKRHGKFGALLFLDLDHFKNLNDSLGHTIGDELLIQLAARLKDQLRKEDFTARLGGDEFVILLIGLSDSLESAMNLARKVTEKMLAVVGQPYILKSHQYHTNSSIGITLFPQEQENASSILRQADIALYRAKANGRNTFQFYHPQMQEAVCKRLEMEANLRLAISADQLQLYYQPQFNHLNQLVGAEVLLRWIHPTLGFIPPDQFISVAEEAGLIMEIGYWIFRHGFKQIKVWQQAGLLKAEQHISINVSPKQFKQENLFKILSEILREIDVSANAIILELTEGVFLANIENTIEKMLQLRGLGFRFSIDDFGTGYSSLAYLKRLPLNELKIDKAFVDDIEHDSEDRAIVETIIAMAQHLKLSVIAEGVENQQQLDFLKQQGCLNYQGYFFSKPLSTAAFEDCLRQHLV
jgi:diguanylate cyclase (GGDEF)-like protein/PAS domain S-box-containing protein